MNEQYDFNSKKYMWLLILVCLLFFIVVMKAFQYLPASESADVVNEKQEVSEFPVTVQQEEKNTEAETKESQAAAEKYKKDHKSGRIVFKDSYTPEFDDIEVPKSTLDEELPKSQEPVQAALTNEELALRAVIEGKRNFNENKYTEALVEYQKVASLTTDKELIAMSYEGISEIYAVSKRYGTALSFAAKAYNTSPSISREMLIARIYYRAGNTENAVTRVNNLLKRDFSH